MKINYDTLTVRQYLDILNKKLKETEGRRYGYDLKGEKLPYIWEIAEACIRDLIVSPLAIMQNGAAISYVKGDCKYKPLDIFDLTVEKKEDNRYRHDKRGYIISMSFSAVQHWEDYSISSAPPKIEIIPVPDDKTTVTQFINNVMLVKLKYNLTSADKNLEETAKTLKYWQDYKSDIQADINRLKILNEGGIDKLVELALSSTNRLDM